MVQKKKSVIPEIPGVLQGRSFVEICVSESVLDLSELLRKRHLIATTDVLITKELFIIIHPSFPASTFFVFHRVWFLASPPFIQLPQRKTSNVGRSRTPVVPRCLLWRKPLRGSPMIGSTWTTWGTWFTPKTLPVPWRRYRTRERNRPVKGSNGVRRWCENRGMKPLKA